VQSSNESDLIATDDSFDQDDLEESSAGPVTSSQISEKGSMGASRLLLKAATVNKS